MAGGFRKKKVIYTAPLSSAVVTSFPESTLTPFTQTEPPKPYAGAVTTWVVYPQLNQGLSNVTITFVELQKPDPGVSYYSSGAPNTVFNTLPGTVKIASREPLRPEVGTVTSILGFVNAVTNYNSNNVIIAREVAYPVNWNKPLSFSAMLGFQQAPAPIVIKQVDYIVLDNKTIAPVPIFGQVLTPVLLTPIIVTQTTYNTEYNVSIIRQPYPASNIPSPAVTQVAVVRQEQLSPEVGKVLLGYLTPISTPVIVGGSPDAGDKLLKYKRIRKDVVAAKQRKQRQRKEEELVISYLLRAGVLN